MNDLDIDPIKQELLCETSKIAWKELQVFFAGGTAVYISEELNLIEVASCFVEDNKAMVSKWMNHNQVMPVSDNQARNWYNHDAMVWAIVVKPWVLVQPLK
ncbi:MAG: DUF2288 domain-containing protein [Gammaproteobacteria bacterium]|nr:DUF2288 domain-containing protein [Gammaproteobacteria bacterium]